MAKRKFSPTLQISPTQAKVATGASLQFSATNNYDPEGPHYIRQPVDFLVKEAEGGSIDSNGTYTAPKKPGTFHVVARREDFSSVESVATVVVENP